MTLHVIKRIDGSIICEIEAENYAAAVSEAVRMRANLAGADLEGAYLARANLAGAYLEGAYLALANLAGAKLTPNHKIKTLIARATRIIEPYEFFLWATDKGPLIRAGCRTMTPAEYREHITVYDYTDTKRAETARILDYFDAAWAAHKGGN